jgi:hypothetical protein
MAKVVFGGAVSEMRNALGNVVYSRSRSGNYTRLKTTIPYHGTDMQLWYAGNLGDCAARWNTGLTDAQRLAWNTYANQMPGPPGHLPPHKLSGFQKWVRQNLYLWSHLGEWHDTPPIHEQVRDQGPVTTLSCNVASSTLVLNVQTNPDATEWLLIQSTKNLNPGRYSFVGLFQDLWQWPGDPYPPGPWNLWNEQCYYRQTPQVGKKIAVWCRMLNRVNGAVTPGSIASCIVT